MSIVLNWYGMFLGLGVVVALELLEYKARQLGQVKQVRQSGGDGQSRRDHQVPQLQIDHTWLRKVLLVGLLAGFVGARLWHVVTDFSLYHDHLLSVFFVWQGGLSIIGGVAGGALGVYWATRWWVLPKHTPQLVLDLLVFGVPFGQAVGRLGNWVNQELYGTPTTLPWGIYIAPLQRVAQYANQEFFHPLFAYEALALCCFGGAVWAVAKRQPSWLGGIGSGKYAILYVFFYGVVRFLLEFLRVQKSMSSIAGLSSNQVVILVVLSGLVVMMAGRRWLNHFHQRLLLGCVVASGVAIVVMGGVVQRPTGVPTGEPVGESNSATPAPLTLAQLRSARYDHRLLGIKLGERELVVELVTTPASITQGLSDRASIGADGMLFVLPEPQRVVFWMPRMQFDLDIIWIADGVVTGVSHAVPKPAPGQDTSMLPRYPSPGKVELVLEVPAGSAQLWQIPTGTAVFLEQLR